MSLPAIKATYQRMLNGKAGPTEEIAALGSAITAVERVTREHTALRHAARALVDRLGEGYMLPAEVDDLVAALERAEVSGPTEGDSCG